MHDDSPFGHGRAWHTENDQTVTVRDRAFKAVTLVLAACPQTKEPRWHMFCIRLTVLIIALVTVLMVYSRHLVRRSEIEYPPQGRFVTVEGVRLHILEKGDGPPVVVVHGSAGSIEGSAAYLLDVVAPKYRVILLDRPGFGNSQPMHEIPTIEAQNRLIHSLLKQLNVYKPILLGHSWSTTLLAGYALDYPEEVGALILMGPAAYLKAIPLLRVIYWLIRVPVLGDIVLRLFPIFGPSGVEKRLLLVFSPAAMPDAFRRSARSIWMRPNSARAFIVDWAPQTFGLSARRIQRRYGEISVPTVLLGGEYDSLSEITQNAVLLHHLIPDSVLSVVPGAGHQIYVTHPEAVLKAIDTAWELCKSEHSLSPQN